jgi:hypothetical protein
MLSNTVYTFLVVSIMQTNSIKRKTMWCLMTVIKEALKLLEDVNIKGEGAMWISIPVFGLACHLLCNDEHELTISLKSQQPNEIIQLLQE